jgi:hypothetical protein
MNFTISRRVLKSGEPFALSVTVLLLCVLRAEAQQPPPTAKGLEVPSATGLVSEPGQTHGVVRFGGAVRGAHGQPVTGLAGVTFAIYAEAQGGAPLWQETQNLQLDDQGNYTVLLGATGQHIPAELLISGDPLWLGVQVLAAGEREQPRVLLAGVPHERRAAGADMMSRPAQARMTSALTAESTDLAKRITPRVGAADPPAVTGSGTVGFVPVWTAESTLGNSLIQETASGGITIGAGIGGGLEIFPYRGNVVNMTGGSASNDIVSGSGATIGGGGAPGAANVIGITTTASFATISGGSMNTANHIYTTVGGGFGNLAGESLAAGCPGTVAAYATVSGGSGNFACDTYSFVGGGNTNAATGFKSFVGGGANNLASGVGSMVVGGSSNVASGSYSLAAGEYAQATTNGSFVWGDFSSVNPIKPTENNQFVVRANGGVWFGTNNAVAFPKGAFLATSTGAYLGTNGAWVNMSDRNVKENFIPVDGEVVLDRLASLPISRWNYIAETPDIHHIGPMAQDFRSAFGLGEDDKHINTIDEGGVALAAIQALYKLSQEKDHKIEDLTRLIEQLEKRLAELEKN